MQPLEISGEPPVGPQVFLEKSNETGFPAASMSEMLVTCVAQPVTFSSSLPQLQNPAKQSDDQQNHNMAT